MDVSELEARRARIRYPVSALAGAAGKDKHTVHRMLTRRNDPVMGTFRAVSDAIVAEERALLAHLKALHPEA